MEARLFYKKWQMDYQKKWKGKMEAAISIRLSLWTNVSISVVDTACPE